MQMYHLSREERAVKNMALSQTELGLLRQIADLEKTPQGAYNIRKNGQADGRSSTANILIESKTLLSIVKAPPYISSLP